MTCGDGLLHRSSDPGAGAAPAGVERVTAPMQPLPPPGGGGGGGGGYGGPPDRAGANGRSLSSRERGRAERLRERGFKALVMSCLGIGLAFLVVLLVQVSVKGWQAFNPDLLSRMPSVTPSRAGIQSALFGTLWVVGLTALLTIPIGVGGAIYLEEYASRDRWYNRLVELNIQNLAAVPAIIYGILGLGLIYRGPLSFGPTVLTAAMTMTLLILPMVIIASREAIRAVPTSIRLGALALGATKWQTTSRQVLPAAVPGIATASILALSRAMGEAAPLLLLGGVTFVTFNPEGLDSSYTTLPILIFNWVVRPQEEFKILAAAAIMTLLVVLLLMNSVAILIRNRYQRKW